MAGIVLNCQCCTNPRSITNTMCMNAFWVSNPSFLMPGRQSSTHSGLFTHLLIPPVFPHAATHSDFSGMDTAPGGTPTTAAVNGLFDGGNSSWNHGGFPTEFRNLQASDITTEVSLSAVLARIITDLEAVDMSGLAWGSGTEYDYKDIPSWYQCFSGPGFNNLLSTNNFTPYDGSLVVNGGVSPGQPGPASLAMWVSDSSPIISLTRTQVQFGGATCAQVTWLIREACTGPPLVFSDPFNGQTVSPVGGIIDIPIPDLVSDFWTKAGPYVSNCTGLDCAGFSGIDDDGTWNNCPVGVFTKIYPQYATYAAWVAAGSPF